MKARTGFNPKSQPRPNTAAASTRPSRPCEFFRKADGGKGTGTFCGWNCPSCERRMLDATQVMERRDRAALARLMREAKS